VNWQQIPWIKLLLTLLIAVGMWWVYANKMEWHEVTEVKNFSRAARENPLLASSRLLKTFGHNPINLSSATKHTLRNIDSNEVIWIMYADAITDEGTIDLFDQWVNDGGHLITGVSEPLSDTWIAELNAATIGVSAGTSIDSKSDSNTITTLRPERSLDAITVEFEAGMNLMPLGDTDIQGVKRATANADGERPYAILQVGYGQGFLTVLADPTIFTNDRLKEHDNASLLLQLLASSPNSNVNYFTEERYVPGLMGTLWEKFPVTILSFCAVLAAWIFYAAARLGPVRQESEPGRTNLISHLRARGHFWRRRRDFSPLSEPVKQAALREIKRHYRLPGADDTLPSHVVKDIAQATGASELRVRRVLSDQYHSQNELPNAANLLQKILNTHLSRSTQSTRFNP